MILTLGVLFACDAPMLASETPDPPPPVVVPQRKPPVEVVTTAKQPGADRLDFKEGTPEFAIRSSLLLLRDGNVDGWVTQWCHPETCSDSTAVAELKRFGLTRATAQAGGCLVGDEDRVFVMSREGDENTGPLKVFVECKGRRHVPSTHALVDGKWLVTSFSW